LKLPLIGSSTVHVTASRTSNQVWSKDLDTGRGNGKAVPLRGLEWPRGFQEVKVPRFHGNGKGRW